jgi:hypothetical protein
MALVRLGQEIQFYQEETAIHRRGDLVLNMVIIDYICKGFRENQSIRFKVFKEAKRSLNNNK